jgi:DDE superfamily endonuclease/Homeodomain-like domain
MPTLSKQERHEIVFEHKNGMNFTQLAKKFKITRSTARKWVARHAETDDVNDLEGRCRKKRIDAATALDAGDMLTNKDYRGCEHVAFELHKQGKIHGDTPPHRTTLARSAKQVAEAVGKPLIVARGKPVNQLTELNKQKRVAFSKANLKRGWGNVMFTDRKKFLLRHPGEKLAASEWLRRGQSRTARTVTKPSVVNVYAGITKFGITSLHFVAGTTKMKHQHKNKKGQVARNITATQYLEVVSKTFLPEGSKMFKNVGITNWVLVQDNDPTHKKPSHEALKAWNSKHNTAITILPEWPPNSPDLNPIENLWAIVQRRVDAVGCKNIDEFQAVVVSAFEKVERETLENLVSSMKRRLKECIAKEGARTKY